MIFAELYKRNGEWKFKAIGQGSQAAWVLWQRVMVSSYKNTRTKSGINSFVQKVNKCLLLFSFISICSSLKEEPLHIVNGDFVRQ